MLKILFWRLVLGKKIRLIAEKSGIPSAIVAKRLQQVSLNGCKFILMLTLLGALGYLA